MFMKRVLLWVLVAVVLMGIGTGVWRWRVAHAKPEATYKTAPVEKRRIVAKVTASGTLSAIVTVQVGAQVSGRISKLNADFNSQVTKNELIAELDPALYQAALDQALANYAQAVAQQVKSRAASVLADKQLIRTKNLFQQSLAAQQDVDTAEATADQAHGDLALQAANVDQAAASLNQARVNLSYCKIYSPIDGVVISRSVDVGQTVAASLQAPILFTIAQDLKQMQVDTNVSEGDVGRLKETMPAYFTVDAYPGKRFHGVISQIRNAATNVQNVVTYDAVIKVENDQLELRPGMTANVTIAYAQRDNVLAIPNAALRFHPPDAVPTANPNAGGGGGGGGSGGGPGRKHGEHADETRTLYVVHGTTATPVTVHAGLTDGSVTEIVDGNVAEGDAIAIDTIDTNAPPPQSSTKTTSPFGGGGGGGGGRRGF
jgi:HlyD family secretion protein